LQEKQHKLQQQLWQQHQQQCQLRIDKEGPSAVQLRVMQRLAARTQQQQQPAATAAAPGAAGAVLAPTPATPLQLAPLQLSMQSVPQMQGQAELLNSSRRT
jgi:hypothetical protein